MNSSEKIQFDNRIKRKNVLALNEKVAAIREFEKTPVYKHVGRSFNCSPDQIKRIIQQKDEILKAWEQRTRRSNEVKSLEMKSVRVSMLGKSVYEWIRRMMYYKDFIITDGLIQKMALQFKSALGIQVFFPHQDWCDKFRHTYKIAENDTKKLKIAYAQGHSVQIKDIIRDVLGACSPSEGDRDKDRDRDREKDGDDDGGESDEADLVSTDADSEAEFRPLELKREPDDEPERPERPTRPARLRRQAAKRRATPAPTPTPTPTPPSLQPTMVAVASPKRHLVALQLPLDAATKGGAKLPQKVLVATPITPASSAPGSAPMTMTIIPLASVAQSLSSPKPQLPERPVVPPPMVEIKRERVDQEQEQEEEEEAMAQAKAKAKAKTGVQQEPAGELALTIKQEYISDDEDEAATATAAGAFDERDKENAASCLLPLASIKRQPAESDGEPEGGLEAAKGPRLRAGEEEEEEEEEDNLVLAQLQKGLVGRAHGHGNSNSNSSNRNKNTTSGNINNHCNNNNNNSKTNNKNNNNNSSSSSSAVRGRHNARNSRNSRKTSSSSNNNNRDLATTPTPTPLAAPTPSPAIAIALSPVWAPPPPPHDLPAMPPLTRAPTAASCNTSASPSSSPSPKRRRHQPHHHHQPSNNNNNNGPDPTAPLPAIRTCAEARKYLKLLEDFALVKENFRLIGLITRADEVLRELDGDDDVDVV